MILLCGMCSRMESQFKCTERTSRNGNVHVDASRFCIYKDLRPCHTPFYAMHAAIFMGKKMEGFELMLRTRIPDFCNP